MNRRTDFRFLIVRFFDDQLQVMLSIPLVELLLTVLGRAASSDVVALLKELSARRYYHSETKTVFAFVPQQTLGQLATDLTAYIENQQAVPAHLWALRKLINKRLQERELYHRSAIA